MSVEAYLEMCEIMGEEADPAMMVSLEDFPEPIIQAFEIYNYLPDEYLSGMDAIYLGKNLTSAPSIFKVYGITDNEDKRLCLWALKLMNDRVRKQSFAKAKAKNKAK